MDKKILTLDIMDFDYEALGVSKYNDKIIFIENALPGEKVNAVITKESKDFAKAKTLEILKKSDDRIDIECPYYHDCGGCNLMHMSYDLELQFKKKTVINTLKKVANIKTNVMDVVKNDSIYNYRNKVIMPIDKDVKTVRGFFKKQTHQLVAVDKCLIENLKVKEIADYLLEKVDEYNISVYNETLHKGLIRNFMFRTNYKNEVMVVVITTDSNEGLINILKVLPSKFNEVVSVYLNINDKKTNVVLSDKYKHIAGDKELLEDINGLKFLVSPAAFMQINRSQTQKMYNKVIEYANLTGKEVVIDAYCGMGSITLNLALKALKVYGIEVVSDSIKNANNNKILNGIDNVEFICGKCEEQIVKLKSKENIDIIVFDPPRKGCDKKFLDTVIDMNISKIVYVSCKVSTFARDARHLMDNGYELLETTPFDLFSRTSHVEIIGLFIKNSSTK